LSRVPSDEEYGICRLSAVGGSVSDIGFNDSLELRGVRLENRNINASSSKSDSVVIIAAAVFPNSQ